MDSQCVSAYLHQRLIGKIERVVYVSDRSGRPGKWSGYDTK